jgi:alpha-N-acetylglucosamine transferase
LIWKEIVWRVNFYTKHRTTMGSSLCPLKFSTRLGNTVRNPFTAKRVLDELRSGVWAESFTKLLAFNQTQYERLLVLDSDSTILRHMDELFFIPSTTVAMPHAYWLDHPFLTSHIMVIQPSVHEFSRIQAAMKSAGHGVYDMDVVNKLYGAACLVLAHRKYALLTGEFRSDDHRKYLGGGKWDPEKVLEEAKFVHFSDDPLPKPWEVTQRELEKMKPECGKEDVGREDCRNRDVWLEFYRDFKERRRVCSLLTP